MVLLVEGRRGEHMHCIMTQQQAFSKQASKQSRRAMQACMHVPAACSLTHVIGCVHVVLCCVGVVLTPPHRH